MVFAWLEDRLFRGRYHKSKVNLEIQISLDPRIASLDGAFKNPSPSVGSLHLDPDSSEAIKDNGSDGTKTDREKERLDMEAVASSPLILIVCLSRIERKISDHFQLDELHYRLASIG